ncbi:hypothetical protein Unana1_03751 [Umbelopsis nana]
MNLRRLQQAAAVISIVNVSKCCLQSLSCGDLLRLLEEDEPEFVVFSTLSGTKHAGRKGDKQFQDFAVGTRKPNDELGSHRDLALGFIALAVLQGSMGPTLLQVIQEPSFGKQLLRTCPNGFHQFDCLKQFEDAAVFVDQRTEAFQVEHHSDKHPLGPLIHPLTTGSTSLILERCGRAVGFNEKLNYSALRTTHSIKAQMFTRMKSWEITEDLAHTSGEKHLHRDIYRPTHLPEDIMDQRYQNWTPSETVAKAIKNVDIFAYRPNPMRIDDFRTKAQFGRL